MGYTPRKRKKRKQFVDHQPEYVDYKESVRMYWRLKGTMPDREVYLMTEADRQESRELAIRQGEIGSRNTTHGLTMFRAGAPEKLLTMLSDSEIVTCGEILELLDEHYSTEMTELERFYHAVQYVKWQRWLVYSFDMDFSDFQKSDLALESQFHKTQTDFYNKLHELRREKGRMQEERVDFIVETIPEDNVVVKKVKYVQKTPTAETRPPESTSGTD